MCPHYAQFSILALSSRQQEQQQQVADQNEVNLWTACAQVYFPN